MNLILGSAQFGLNYGVTNQFGQLKLREIKKILQHAISNNINIIDTASAYGKSEKNIGSFSDLNFKIITKLPQLSCKKVNIQKDINKIIKNSLNNLKINNIDTLLIHAPDQLLTERGDLIYKALNDLKDNKLINKLGISVYDTKILKEILNKYDIDVVQAPVNIFDTRFIKQDITSLLLERDIKLHARSIFLQGVLLNSENLPNYFKKWTNIFDEYRAWASNISLSPLDICIQFLKKNKMIEGIIIGVDSLDQLKEVIKSYNNDSDVDISPPEFINTNSDLINPTKWKI